MKKGIVSGHELVKVLLIVHGYHIFYVKTRLPILVNKSIANNFSIEI